MLHIRFDGIKWVGCVGTSTAGMISLFGAVEASILTKRWDDDM